MSENKKYFKMIKTCVGGLDVELVNPLTNAKQRLFFEADTVSKIVPIEWAATVYADTSSGAYKMFKQGYFTFDDVKPVKDYAIEHGFLMGDVDFDNEPTTYNDDILVALKSSTRSKIDKYLDTQKHQEDLCQIAREHISELNVGIIKYIEDKLKIALRVEGE